MHVKQVGTARPSDIGHKFIHHPTAFTGNPPEVDSSGGKFFFKGVEMDTLTVQAIQANTAAVNALTGTLWVFIGVIMTMICGYLVTRYTLRG